jgi:hypothetical protein
MLAVGGYIDIFFVGGLTFLSVITGATFFWQEKKQVTRKSRATGKIRIKDDYILVNIPD